jgi:hypothetical protein
MSSVGLSFSSGKYLNTAGGTGICYCCMVLASTYKQHSHNWYDHHREGLANCCSFGHRQFTGSGGATDLRGDVILCMRFWQVKAGVLI